MQYPAHRHTVSPPIPKSHAVPTTSASPTPRRSHRLAPPPLLGPQALPLRTTPHKRTTMNNEYNFVLLLLFFNSYSLLFLTPPPHSYVSPLLWVGGGNLRKPDVARTYPTSRVVCLFVYESPSTRVCLCPPSPHPHPTPPLPSSKGIM